MKPATRLRSRCRPSGVCGAARAPGFARTALATALQAMLAGGLLASGGAAQAAGPAFGSPAWIQQRTAQPPAVPPARPATGPSAGVPGAGQTPAQAAVRAQRAIGDLARAAQAIAQAQAAQTAARQIALAQPNPADVSDGLGPQGLQPAAGVPADLARPTPAEDPTLWQNAERPRQTASGARTTVTVRQTAAKAILTWDAFNVGRDTTLHFDQRAGTQSDGSNEWVALNRVTDASARPSRILGEIRAEGSVYLINRNGIVFGGASQVNTHSLVASSLAFLGDDRDLAASNRRFLQEGLLDLGGTARTILGLGSDGGDPSIDAGSFVPGGDIRIEPGAQLQTGTNGVLLIAAPQIVQAGTIETRGGDAVLAAGIGVQVQPPTTLANGRSTGLQFGLIGNVSEVQDVDGVPQVVDVTPVSRLEQRGLIAADRGRVTLLGSRIDQFGVVTASTGLTQPGSIAIRAEDGVGNRRGLVRFGPGSLTAVLPVDDGTTTTSSPSAEASFQPGRIDVTGASVRLESGALIEAPGADVSLTAVLSRDAPPMPTALDDHVGGRLYLERDAVIDVSGLADVQLPASASRLEIPRIGQNELADAPLQRLGFLFGQRRVVLDATAQGTRDDGYQWVGSPLLNVRGYLELVPRRIDQLLVDGGSLVLKADEAVITRAGSRLELDGGYINVLPGRAPGATRLLGADGRVYDLSTAPTDIDYVGIAGQHDSPSRRWNQDERWFDPVAGGALDTFEPGYIAGADAGRLTIEAASAVLEGGLSARAHAGRHQVASGLLPQGGTLSLVAAGLLQPGNENGVGVVFQATRPDLESLTGGAFDALSSLRTAAQAALAPDDTRNLTAWMPMSTADLREAGLSTVAVNATDGVGAARTARVRIDRDARLSVADGGAVRLYTNDVQVEGRIEAHGGRIEIATQDLGGNGVPVITRDLVVGEAASLDVSGRWINDTGLAIDDRRGPAHVDGGSIDLRTEGGLIDLREGSRLDVSGGGYMDAEGVLRQRDGVPLGRVGSLGLRNLSVPAGTVRALSPELANQPDARTGIHFEATLRAGGFATGGSFAWLTPRLRLGGEPAADGTGHLETDFFQAHAFGAHDLGGVFGVRVAAGTTIAPSARLWRADLDALTALPSGSALVEGQHYGIARPEGSLRPAVDFSLTQRWTGDLATQDLPGLVVEREAAILAEAGSRIRLASPQLTLQGRLVAHGGQVILDGRPDGSAAGSLGSGSLWLGRDAVIDVSGIAVLDPLVPEQRLADGSAFRPRVGEVLDGGRIELRYSGGYVAAQAGSVLDVSGASGTFDLPAASPDEQGRTTVERTVWSDAGSITMQAGSGLFVDARLRGAGGDARAAGGRLHLLSGDAGGAGSRFVLRAGGEPLPADASPTAVEPGAATPGGLLNVPLARLEGSGLSDLIIGQDSAGEPVGAALPVVFSGDVGLRMTRSIQLNGSALVLADVGASDPATAPTGPVTVNLAAPYVSLGGYAPTGMAAPVQPTQRATGTSLDVQARQVDIGGRLSLEHVGRARIAAEGDVRLHNAFGGFDVASGRVVVGQLLTAGDLLFEASQLYPVTATRFALIAQAGPEAGTGLPTATTIEIRGPGGAVPPAPLAAGGALLLNASRIVQAGVLRAPGGELVLGHAADDPLGAAAFGDAGAPPLLAVTEQVVLAAGSRTSVSLEGMTVPYGSTVDGIDWRYDPIVAGTRLTTSRLSAPPAKLLRIDARDVALDEGATIDVSGGGDLQASEWIPGTGGSRDVLSRYNTDYGGTAGPRPLPLYPDERRVYAILPGFDAPSAPIDPATGASRVANSERVSDLPDLGRRVRLTGVPGLAAGDYTLLPAAYAALPGALRLVQDTAALDSLAAGNQVQPDGSFRVAGRFVDAFDGSTEARSTRFIVQRQPVWRQYSEYRFTSANAYFGELARASGTAAPARPVDAGQFSVAALGSLQFDAALSTAGGRAGRLAGAAASIDIAAPRMQIVGGADTPRLDGYLVLEAGRLSELGAGSLLLGGVRRTADAQGQRLDAVASSVVLSNAGGAALTGPEVMLVTGGDSVNGTTDGGLRLEADSVLRATGSGVSAAPARYRIGQAEDATAGTPARSGRGALLRVSNGSAVVIDRRAVDADTGRDGLSIGAGAVVDGGERLLLDATGDTSLDATAVLGGRSVEAGSNRVSFTSGDASGLDGLVIGPATLAQIADAQQVILRSRSSIDFIGDLSLDFSRDLQLSAGRFTSDGGSVRLRAGTLQLDNTLRAPADAAAAGTGSMQLSAQRLQFGDAATTGEGGSFVVSGLGSLRADVGGDIRSAGRATVDFGTAAVDLSAPAFVAGAGADVSLRTGGAMRLLAADGTAPADNPLGGRFDFVGGSLFADARLRAASGRLGLRATEGDLVVDGAARLDASGVDLAYFDARTSTPGGSIRLEADQGQVRLGDAVTLDVSGRPAEGGSRGSAGGDLQILATLGEVRTGGQWRGQAGTGQAGGRFALEVGGTADLDGLAAALDGSGLTGAVSVRSGRGALQLSAGRSLQAQEVTLVADGDGTGGAGDGQVQVAGTIDASGEDGGRIRLYGRRGVLLDGTLAARGSAEGDGGRVMLGTAGRGDGRLDALHGHQEVAAADAGALVLGSGAVIDVGGGGKAGRIDLRLPLLDDGEVPLVVQPGAALRGAGAVSLEAYAVWSTTDALTEGSTRHFDGLVDPAGLFDATGQRVAGRWTDAQGTPADADGRLPDPVTGTRDIDPTRDLFIPDAGAVNLDHRDFYQSTLSSFVRAPGFGFEARLATTLGAASDGATLRLRPGIELRNDDPSQQGGSIQVLSDWNLGAVDGAGLPTYRLGGLAPVLTLRAAGDVQLRASLSDGFEQRGNVRELPVRDASVANEFWLSGLSGLGLPDTYVSAPADLSGEADTAGALRYYGLYQTYAGTLLSADTALGGLRPVDLYQIAAGSGNSGAPGPVAPVPPADPARYPEYLQAWRAYLGEVYAAFATSGVLPALEPLATPAAVPTGLIAWPTDNSASPLRTRDNPLPLYSATLTGGDSSSWRLVAGARADSSDPLSVGRAPDGGADGSGSVRLEGHVRYTATQVDPFGTASTRDALLPLMLRTGSGDIDVAAALDIRADDTLAPGVIVSAGRQRAGAAFDPSVVLETRGVSHPALPVSGVNQPVDGGDIRLSAGRDLVGRQALFYPEDGSLNGGIGGHYAQYWAPWTRTSNLVDGAGGTLQTGLNFSGFSQGVLGIGGRLELQAGRDIVEWSASLPTTLSASITADGSRSLEPHGSGGRLEVRAGRDILSGTYFVSQGSGELLAGGRIGAAFDVGPFPNAPSVSGAVSTLIGLQDSRLEVRAAQGVDLAGAVNPDAPLSDAYDPATEAWLPESRQPMGAGSELQVQSLGGDLRFGSLKVPRYLYSYGAFGRDIVLDPLSGGSNDVQAGPATWPARLRLESATGAVWIERGGQLAASPDTLLSVLAQGDVRTFDDVGWVNQNTGLLVVAGTPQAGTGLEPVRLYSATGDVFNGRLDPASGFVVQPLQWRLDRPLRVLAGRDVVNPWLLGRHDAAVDLSLLGAGRDLFDTDLAPTSSAAGQQSAPVDIRLAGPGTLLVQAGRNVGPFVALDRAAASGYVGPTSGIATIGRAGDAALPIRGADVVILFGVGPGLDLEGFGARYLDPAVTPPEGLPSYGAELVAFARRQGAPATTGPQDAYAYWRGLPQEQRLLLAQQVFLDVLRRTGIAQGEPDSPLFGRYASGYQAIETLFPSARGYTANRLGDGDANGAEQPVFTGRLDLRGSSVQTQQGGDISILGPGGEVLVGSSSAAPLVRDLSGNVLVGPNQLGILALRDGNINVFADLGVLVAQSRIFTRGGGDILLWSSNGDVNAGRGAKTTADTPAPRFICSVDLYCRVDESGQVTGAGIATLASLPGAPTGDAVLIAPAGTVDAGDAGIRVSGSLVIAAQAVANADNVQVQGASVGVPTGRVDSGALAAAGAAAAAAEQAADELAARSAPAAGLSTLISVEILGFGRPDEEQRKRLQPSR